MSGLLPRTPTGGQTGSFDNLNVQTLTVSISGFINTLTANEMTVGDLEVTSITTGTINGNPNLNIVATTASVGGDTIVTRTATQTLTNKTLTSPIISTISNTGTLTLPTSTDTLVGRATTDTLTNKTLTAPVISTITNTGTLTLPTSTTTLVGRLTTDTLTNKTLDSASNTITITSGSLSADNINNVLNQRLKTTNSPTFVTVNAQQLLLVNAINDSITVQSTTSQNNQILFTTTGPTNQTGVGYDNLNSLHRLWGYVNSPMVFATNNLERLRIPAGGVANDNTITNILGLSGTTLAYKNNVVDTSTAQSLTNKDFPSGFTLFAGKMSILGRYTQTTTDASTVSYVTIPIPTLNTYMIQSDLVAYCTAGTHANQSAAQRFVTRAQQVAGVITGGVIQNSFSNQFSTNLGHIASGTDIIVQTTGTILDTINWAIIVTVYTL